MSKDLKKMPTKELQVGMYVRLGKSWLQHSFLTPNFKIKSDQQIKRIISSGIREVTIDLSKSTVEEKHNLARDLGFTDKLKDIGRPQGDIEAPETFDPMAMIGDELRAAIENTHIPPQTKAKAVYDHSVKMMDNILQDPSPENILAGKTMIHETVDHILADDETADFLSKITSHDYYTYTHSVNVGMLSVLLAKRVFQGSFSSHNMQELGAGFFLHDLGKCDVPNTLLNKRTTLSDSEWELMRNHPSRGNQLLSDADQLTTECGLIVMQHHEREDGTGYPFGKIGDEIHLYGRICTIADVYDALTSTRAYKKKLPPFEALKIMKEEMIHHFHPELFAEFVQIFQ